MLIPCIDKNVSYIYIYIYGYLDIYIYGYTYMDIYGIYMDILGRETEASVLHVFMYIFNCTYQCHPGTVLLPQNFSDIKKGQCF